MTLQQAKEGKKGSKIGSERFLPYAPAAYPTFPALPPMGTAVKLPFPDFLLSDRRKTGNAALPPMRAAVKLQLPDFLLSEWRKTGK
ncbi:hypothetical protein MRB53_001235 [Persea americana]|uniref:Uncharacterized protein n=1 Tax=Persea americana TaxID=3435 RepID=A0ACC2MTH8_PERAE|nr:hypothetical protein MRB53_001235 [Persea americana]